MASDTEVRLHCPACLEANHRGCFILTPAKREVHIAADPANGSPAELVITEWEGGGGRCVCKCAFRLDTRLTNVERKCEELRIKAPKIRAKPGPKTQTRDYAHQTFRPTKWDDRAIMQLVTLEKEGLTSRQIGERVGSHMDTVRTYLKVARARGWR